jgi:hypothetical protein
MLAAPLVASGPMAAAVYGLRTKLVAGLLPELAWRAPLLVGVGVISYALCLLLLARSVYREAALFVAALRGGEAV